MYKVADNLIPIACGQESRDIKAKILIGKEEFNDSHILDFVLENSITSNEDLELGGCVASRLNLKLRTDKTFLKQQKVLLWLQLFKQDDESVTTGAVPMGEFYIDDITVMKVPNSSINIISLVCFDRFAAMNKNYVSTIPYPSTAGLVLSEISSQLKIPLDVFSLNLTNMAFYIKDRIENAVYRDVLRWIASLNGGFFIINREGKLQFKLFDKTPTSDKVKLKEGKFFELPKTSSEHKLVKKLVFNQDTELEAIGVGLPVPIEQTLFAYNPFVNIAQANKAFAAVQGINYKPMTINCPGNVIVDAGDTLTVIAINGAEEQIVVLRHTISYKGGLKSTIESPASSTPIIEQKSIGLSQNIKDLNQRLGVFLQHINPEGINVSNDLKQIASIPIKTRSRTDLKFTNTMIISASEKCMAQFVMESEGNVIRHPWPVPLVKGVNLISFSTTEKDLPTLQGHINYKMSSGITDVTVHIEPRQAEFTIYGGSIIAGSEIPVLDFKDTLEDFRFRHSLIETIVLTKPNDEKRNVVDNIDNSFATSFIKDSEQVEIQLIP